MFEEQDGARASLPLMLRAEAERDEVVAHALQQLRALRKAMDALDLSPVEAGTPPAEPS